MRRGGTGFQPLLCAARAQPRLSAHIRSSQHKLNALVDSPAPQRTYYFTGHDRKVLGARHVGRAKGIPQHRIGACQAAVLQVGKEGTGKGRANARKGRNAGSRAICGLKH